MELDVGGNSFGDDGILHICEGLKGNDVINELKVQKCEMSGKGTYFTTEFQYIASYC